MPISTEHAGRTYPSQSYTVTAGKIAEFAAALGDENLAYQGADAIAPPTFPVVLANWGAVFGDPDLGLALNRTIHVEQKFAYTRPLRAGDDVTATVTIANVRVRGAVDMVTVETRVDLEDRVETSVDPAEREPAAGEAQDGHIVTMTSTLFHTREEEA